MQSNLNFLGLSCARALVVAAHSDDEALGCGGTMARLAEEGWDVGVVFMTNGVGARVEESRGDQIQQRRQAAELAVRTLGARICGHFDYPDNAMDSVSLLQICQSLETVAREFRPDVVFTHSLADLNVDHGIVHRATLTAFRPLPGSSVAAIFCFEVPSSTGWGSASAAGFQPTLYVDVTLTFQQKLEALRCYDAEMRAAPHPRSVTVVESLAQWRGGLAGLERAEAFEVQRIIV
jgi:LmbE family N-acetylglucosaminyl deacetylase